VKVGKKADIRFVANTVNVIVPESPIS